MEEDLSIILELQSPFRWQPVIRNENRYEFDLEQEDAGTFSFLNFCARIVQVYDEYLNRGKTSGHELLEDVDKRLQELENSNCQDNLYMMSKDAIYHVFFACKTQMALFSGKLGDELKEWMQRVKKFDEMDASNKAAMYAIKACAHSLYSSDGLDTSLSQINMALSYDKTTAYWLFLKGTILQKIRPTNEVPSLQEREAFVAAHEKENSNPLFMVYLADSLRETCKYKPRTYLWFIAKTAQVNAEDKINEKHETALGLYRKSYELKPNCPVIAFKCANGLMRLPQKFQDVKLIKKIISDCEKTFPDSGFGNLVCALYYERINKKIAITQRCLEKCVELNVFNGCMNSIRIDFSEKKENSNVVEKLEKMLDIFSEAARQEIIISQLISYFVFVTGDIEKACEYMLKYYRKKSSGRHLEKHQSCFKSTEGPISLVDVITDQVKIKLKNRQLPAEKRKFYNDFVRQMNFHNVDVLKGNPKNLLEQIHKSAVPKGKNPNKAHSNEAQRNSSQQNRQSNDRSKYGPRNGEVRRREDGPPDRRGAGRSVSRENVHGNNASPRRRDDRRPEDRQFDHRSASFDKRPDRRFGGPNTSRENAQRNDASPRGRDDRRPENRAVDNRPASFDKRSNSGFGGRAENTPRNDTGHRKGDNCQPEERRTNWQPVSSGKSSAVVKTKAAKSNSDPEYQLMMDLCREGNRSDMDAIFDKWKSLLKESNKGRSDVGEIRRTVPEEYDRQQANHRASEAPDEVASKGGSRRSKNDSSENGRGDRGQSEASNHSHRHEHRQRKPSKANEDVAAVSKEQNRGLEHGSLEDRRRDRSLSEASDRSHRHKHRHGKPSKANEDVAVSKEQNRGLEHGLLEDRHRDRSLSEASGRSRRHKHRHGKSSKANEDVAVSKEPSRGLEHGSLEDRRRDRSLSEASDRSRRHKHRHRKHKKHRDSSGSEDERGHRRSESPSRRHRRRSDDRHGRKSHRKHRNSESAADSERSVDRLSRKSHRKHRKSESASDSERSADRKRDKEKRSHHRSKKHSSTERRREKGRSHRDHEKSSRRKKESKKGNSDSERSDSR